MDHLTEIRIPDVSPVDIADSDQDFSMCAGEFVEVSITSTLVIKVTIILYNV